MFFSCVVREAIFSDFFDNVFLTNIFFMDVFLSTIISTVGVGSTTKQFLIVHVISLWCVNQAHGTNAVFCVIFSWERGQVSCLSISRIGFPGKHSESPKLVPVICLFFIFHDVWRDLAPLKRNKRSRSVYLCSNIQLALGAGSREQQQSCRTSWGDQIAIDKKSYLYSIFHLSCML